MMDNDGRATGQSNAVQKIWADMAPRLELYLRSFSGLSPHEKEDVLQEVMVALWRDSPDSEEAVKPWLFRVTRNRAIDALRHAKRITERERFLPEGPLALIDRMPASGPNPEEAALCAEDAGFVRNFLAGLADQDREILHLTFAEDMAYSRIADLLSLPLGTVKWRVAELKSRLAARYRKEFT
jgi:RNA polymerase sigma-70 factor, ECF subfamily